MLFRSTPIPGTTRDTLEESVSIGGVGFRITDTAGLRDAEAADPVEALGMKRSRESVGGADVVLWLLDASETGDALRDRLAEMEMARSRTHAKFIPCWNKMDAAGLAQDELDRVVAEFMPPADPAAKTALPAFEYISAKTGDGLDRLRDRLERTVWDGLPAASQSGGAAVSERHAALLEQAADRLGHAADNAMAGFWELAGSSLRTAAELVGCITGETATPDVLDEIFARFCIGK